MKELLVALITASLCAAPPVLAAEKGKQDDPAHVKQDILDHRAMAEAHLNAAKCLESGRPEKDCLAQLGRDCKGLGIGKYCGMKHRH